MGSVLKHSYESGLKKISERRRVFGSLLSSASSSRYSKISPRELGKPEVFGCLTGKRRMNDRPLHKRGQAEIFRLFRVSGESIPNSVMTRPAVWISELV